MQDLPQPTPPRDLREEPSFTAQAKLLEDSAKRLDEKLHGVTWAIARAAERFPVIRGTPFRLARAQQAAGQPILRVYFTINSPELCSLWWIDETDDPGDSAEAID
jgi:hypothetical protein